MNQSAANSVSLWIQDLKQGREDAAAALWGRYFDRLVILAKHRLGNSEKRVADEEDLAATVFYALCDGAANGRFKNLQNRNDLWMLLVAMTGHKVVDQVRRQTSQKRGGGHVRGDSILSPQDGGPAPLGDLLAGGPTPEMLVSMDDQYRWLMDRLHDDVQREIVQRKLAGHPNREIARALSISLRSVERKLEVIRDAWTNMMDSQ
ncbi:MAG: ECF-type sigma factor [Planctomycetota bacterium]